MGYCFLTGAGSVAEAQGYLDSSLRTTEQQWEQRVGGVMFTDPTRSNEECELLFDGFTPSILPELDRITAIPNEVKTHLQHLKDYRSADPAAITNAQTVHVVQDLIRALFYTYKRFEDEG